MSAKKHPYQQYEKLPIWKALDNAVSELVRNGDLEEQTAREYIIGYLAKTLTEEGFQQVAELHSGHKVLRVVEVREPRIKAAG
jgi:hypothetical protein